MASPDADKTAKLWGLIKDIRFAMMTSEDGKVLRSRPMAASQQEFDGNLWFFTRLDSAKVREVGADDRVCLSYADPDRQHYVSVSGRARLVRDPEELRAHWSEAIRVWVPKGVDDPDLALLRVEVEQAEYWDAPSSAMVHAYGYARAVLTGTSPGAGEHEKLSFR
jgi:general stress protein 26